MTSYYSGDLIDANLLTEASQMFFCNLFTQKCNSITEAWHIFEVNQFSEA